MLDIETIVRRLGIIIRTVELAGCRAATRKIPNGYLILIDGRLDRQSQHEALNHELLHIIFGHLDDRSELPEEVKEAEVRADWLWTCEGRSV